jgi:hypothetical protein
MAQAAMLAQMMMLSRGGLVPPSNQVQQLVTPHPRPFPTISGLGRKFLRLALIKSHKLLFLLSDGLETSLWNRERSRSPQ